MNSVRLKKLSPRDAGPAGTRLARTRRPGVTAAACRAELPGRRNPNRYEFDSELVPQ